MINNRPQHNIIIIFNVSIIDFTEIKHSNMIFNTCPMKLYIGTTLPYYINNITIPIIIPQ